MGSPWDLPGPASYVDAIEDALRNGASVILRFPLQPPQGLARVLRGRLDSLLQWTALDGSAADEDLVGFLRREICPDGGAFESATMAAPASDAGFQGRLVWVEPVSPEVWPAWSAPLRAYSDASRDIDLDRRTLFVLVLTGETVGMAPIEEAALVCYDFRGVVDTLDLFVHALREMPRGRMARQHRALLAQVIASLGQWDIALADHLLGASADEILEPAALLETFAHGLGWHSGTPRRWECGTVDGESNQPVVHSALLEVSGESREVARRLWAAQAGILLPLVEERRVALVREHRRRIRLPVETEEGPVTDPFDLSVGQLAWLLDRSGEPWRLRKEIVRLRRVRNVTGQTAT